MEVQKLGEIRSSWGGELPLNSSSGAGSSLLSPVVKGMVATARNRKNSIQLRKKSACWKVSHGPQGLPGNEPLKFVAPLFSLPVKTHQPAPSLLLFTQT